MWTVLAAGVVVLGALGHGEVVPVGHPALRQDNLGRDAGRGWQRYGPDTLTRLAVIELAKGTGFSLDEIAELLAALDTGGSPAATWQVLAAAKLADLDAPGRPVEPYA